LRGEEERGFSIRGRDFKGIYRADLTHGRNEGGGRGRSSYLSAEKP